MAEKKTKTICINQEPFSITLFQRMEEDGENENANGEAGIP